MLTISVKGAARIHGDLRIPAGVHAVLGLSGAGKTSLFRLITGLDQGFSSTFQWNGLPFHDNPVFQRPVAYVPQRPSLVPHRTIQEQVKWVQSPVQSLRLDQWMDILEIKPHWRQYPRQLSGGQQQRAALFRALAANRPILLLDEALSGIDKPHRLRIFQHLKAAWPMDKLLLFSTHDWEEAESFADHLIYLEACHLLKSQTGQEARPITPRMAALMGYVGSVAVEDGHLLIHPRTTLAGLHQKAGVGIPGQLTVEPLSPTLAQYRFIPRGQVTEFLWTGMPIPQRSDAGITLMAVVRVNFSLNLETLPTPTKEAHS